MEGMGFGREQFSGRDSSSGGRHGCCWCWRFVLACPGPGAKPPTSDNNSWPTSVGRHQTHVVSDAQSDVANLFGASRCARYLQPSKIGARLLQDPHCTYDVAPRQWYRHWLRDGAESWFAAPIEGSAGVVRSYSGVGKCSRRVSGFRAVEKILRSVS
jgi:hypothetical protein